MHNGTFHLIKLLARIAVEDFLAECTATVNEEKQVAEGMTPTERDAYAYEKAQEAR